MSSSNLQSFKDYMDVQEIILGVTNEIINQKALNAEIRRVLIETGLGKQKTLTPGEIKLIAKKISYPTVIRHPIQGVFSHKDLQSGDSSPCCEHCGKSFLPHEEVVPFREMNMVVHARCYPEVVRGTVYEETKTHGFLVHFFNQAAKFSHDVRMTSVPFKKGDGILIYKEGELHVLQVSSPPVKWHVVEADGLILTEIHVTYQDTKPFFGEKKSEEDLKWEYARLKGSDSIVGLDSCDDYKKWRENYEN